MAPCLQYRASTVNVEKFCLCFVLVVVAIVAWTSAGTASPLADYVSLPDDAYAWRIVDDQMFPDGFRLLQIDLTSQTWQKLVWRHRLAVVIPPQARSPKAALLLVSASGSGRDEVSAVKQMAEMLGVPTAVLMDTPNQPLFLGLREDALIAYTFVQYVATGDPEWPLLLPMVKGVVRAMDTLQALSTDEFGWDVDQFVVTGASKRGWTTWLTAAVDERVVGIAPMVYNNLDLAAQMDLQGRTFAGGASPKIHDYTDVGFHEVIATPAGKDLISIVDPYAYLDRLTVPKLLLHGTNDPYWPTDAVDVYWDALAGEKFLVNIPNAGHDLNDMDRVLGTIGLFFQHVTAGPILPDLSWSIAETEDAFTLRVPRSEMAQKASLWAAVAPTRDFTDVMWTELAVKVEGDAWIVSPLALPRQYLALFVSVEFELASGAIVTFDTPVYVLDPK